MQGEVNQYHCNPNVQGEVNQYHCNPNVQDEVINIAAPKRMNCLSFFGSGYRRGPFPFGRPHIPLNEIGSGNAGAIAARQRVVPSPLSKGWIMPSIQPLRGPQTAIIWF